LGFNARQQRSYERSSLAHTNVSIGITNDLQPAIEDRAAAKPSGLSAVALAVYPLFL